MKLVFDTNVLIAALITKGVCAELLEHCVLQHEIVSSEIILAEVYEHLAGKFKYSFEEASHAVQLLRSQMVVVVPTRLDPPVCRDADDDFILTTAIAGRACCIVTGDKDLLILQRHQTIDIISPSLFDAFEAGSDER